MSYFKRLNSSADFIIRYTRHTKCSFLLLPVTDLFIPVSGNSLPILVSKDHKTPLNRSELGMPIPHKNPLFHTPQAIYTLASLLE